MSHERFHLGEIKDVGQRVLENAQNLKVHFWKRVVDGEVDITAEYHIDGMLDMSPGNVDGSRFVRDLIKAFRDVKPASEEMEGGAV